MQRTIISSLGLFNSLCGKSHTIKWQSYNMKVRLLFQRTLPIYLSAKSSTPSFLNHTRWTQLEPAPVCKFLTCDNAIIIKTQASSFSLVFHWKKKNVLPYGTLKISNWSHGFSSLYFNFYCFSHIIFGLLQKPQSLVPSRSLVLYHYPDSLILLRETPINLYLHDNLLSLPPTMLIIKFLLKCSTIFRLKSKGPRLNKELPALSHLSLQNTHTSSNLISTPLSSPYRHSLM